MIKFLQSLVNRGERSVASITANLHNTIGELEAHAEDMRAKASEKLDQIMKLEEEQAAHIIEQAQASKVAQNIKALLG